MMAHPSPIARALSHRRQRRILRARLRLAALKAAERAGQLSLELAPASPIKAPADTRDLLAEVFN